jgi:hypothetical protein
MEEEGIAKVCNSNVQATERCRRGAQQKCLRMGIEFKPSGYWQENHPKNLKKIRRLHWHRARSALSIDVEISEIGWNFDHVQKGSRALEGAGNRRILSDALSPVSPGAEEATMVCLECRRYADPVEIEQAEEENVKVGTSQCTATLKPREKMMEPSVVHHLDESGVLFSLRRPSRLLLKQTSSLWRSDMTDREICRRGC